MSVIMVWAWMHWPMDVDGSMDVIMAWAWAHWPMGVDGLVWDHGRYHGLGMDARMDVIMVWAWMHWLVSGLVACRLSWFGHGCTGQWTWMVAWTLPWFGHGCTGQWTWMGWGSCHGLGMDALANEWAVSMDFIMAWAWMHWPMSGLVVSLFKHGCTGQCMDAIMVWAWMHWPMDGLVAWTLSWFWHGCTGQWMGW